MVFIIQVVFISWYMPKNIKNKIKNIINDYPPKEYPKLYPVSVDAIKMGLIIFNGFNWIVFMIGAWVVAYGAYSQSSEMLNVDSSAVLMGFFFLQWLPYLVLEFTSFKYLKLMRQASTHSLRKASLKPRRFLNYITTFNKVLIIMSHLLFFGVVEYYVQNPFEHFGGYENLMTMVFIDVFLLGIVAWNIVGKKLNPHITSEDRIKQIETIVRAMSMTIVLVLLFGAVNLVMSAKGSRHWLDLFLSVYFILISIVSFQSYQFNQVNFDVYKESYQ